MTNAVSVKQEKNAKRRSKARLAIAPIAIVLAVAAVITLVIAVSLYVKEVNAPIPLTDLPATYKGEIKDAEGNLLVPFDVAYPEEFRSGNFEYRKDALLLKMDDKFHGDMTLNLKKCGFSSIEKSVATNNGTWYEAKIAEGEDITTVIQRARSLEEVLMADYDYVIKTTDTEVESVSGELNVNDVHGAVHGNGQLKNQWFLNSAGIQDAWKFLDKKGIEPGGSSSIVVAVIDTGVDYNHPDLKANMWVNANEIPDNGRDDDGNGYVDDYYGYNTVANKGSGMDVHGHGTHVAGIIAASNNKEGVVGIAYNAKIMTIAAGQATGTFLQNDIAEAIIYAYEMGADVINMSFGGSACSIATQDALMTAYTRSTLVAAAGNDSLPNQTADHYPLWGDYLPSYPAALSYVIGVMSVNKQGIESGFTNWDAHAFNTVEYEVYAPGEGIYSTLAGGGYGNLSGTSMAAPVVSGMAALLRSYFSDRDMYPSKYIQAQICATSEDDSICCSPKMHVVKGNVHAIDPYKGEGVYYRTGVMIANAYMALTKLPKPDVNLYDYYIFDGVELSEKNNGDGVADAGETLDIAVVLRNRWGMSKDTVVTIDSLSVLGVVNPYVEILIGTENYDSVGTYSTKSMLVYDQDNFITGYTKPLRVKISEDCPNDYHIGLNVTCTFGNALDEKDKATYTNNSYYYKGDGISFDVRNGVILPSQITEDMTLTKNNLYILPNSTYIAKGVTVTVEPGTRVQFWSDDPNDPYAQTAITYLSVEGTFICAGSEEEPVELFPSDLMADYRVEITKTGEGRVDLSYTTVTNPVLDIDTADHCTFRQNYTSDMVFRYLFNGTIKETGGMDTGVAAVFAKSVTNSLFYKCGSADNGSATSSFYPMKISGSFDTCAFVDTMINFSYSSSIYLNGINGNGRSGTTPTTTNCVFMGNYATNEGGSIGVSSMKQSAYKLPTIRKIVRNNETGTTYLVMTSPSGTNDSAEKFGFCRSLAQLMGGDLLCIETESEIKFLKDHDISGMVGLVRGADKWINGETIPSNLTGQVDGNFYAAHYNALSQRYTFGGGNSSFVVELPGSIYCDTIQLEEYSAEIDLESGYQLTPSVIPATFDVKGLVYVSEDPAVATVDASGRVTPVAKGETRIFAYAPDYQCHAVMTLRVVEKVKLTGITLPEVNATLKVGDTLKLQPTLTPANTTERLLTFASSNPAVLTVDDRGNVTAVGNGTATVTVTGANGHKVTYTAKVISPVESISFTNKFYVTFVGDTNTEWMPTVAPANATDYTLTWLSSNPEVAYVNDEGELIRVAPGSATLRATITGTELYAELNVSVSDTAAFANAKVVEMDAYGGWILAVTDDHTLWLWGGNELRVPVKIAEGVKDAMWNSGSSGGITCYAYYLFVLRTDGTVEMGEIPKDTGRYRPYGYQSIVDDLTDVVALEHRTSSYYALRADGTVWAWGTNTYGQLGDGTTVRRGVIVQMGVTDVKKVQPFNDSVLLLTNDGKVYCYGTLKYYTFAQLICEGAIDIYSGAYYASITLRDGTQLYVYYDGSVKAFATGMGTYYANSSFRLDGETVYWRDKTTHCPDIEEIVYICFDSDPSFFYYRTTDGKLYGVGKNNYFQLADLTQTDRTIPTRIFLGLDINNAAPALEHINLSEEKLTADTLVLDFDVALLTGSNYGTIKLKDAAGNLISLNKQLVLDKLTIAPVAGWVHGMTYTLTVPADTLINVYGVANTELVYTFTCVNTTPISQISASVADGAVLTDTALDLSLGFTVANKGTAFDAITLTSGGVAVPGVTVALANNTLTFVGTVDYGDYTLTVPAGALCDNVGGENEAITLSFRIVRTLKPTASSVADGALRVDEREAITLTFEGALQGEQFSAISLKATDGTPVPATVTLENGVLTVAHAGLAQGTAYVLTLPAGALTDEAGTVSEEITLGFTTYAPVALTHASTAAGGKDVALLPQFILIYNNDNGDFTVDTSKLTLTAADGTAVALTVTAEGDRLVVTTETALDPDSAYTLTLAEGVMTDERGALSAAATFLLSTVKQSERFFWSEESVTAKINEWIKEGYNTHGFTGNAILNNYQDTNVEHWLRITADQYQSSEEYMKSIGLAGNYWGTVNEELIGMQILDFDDFQSLADINYKNYLTTAPSNTYPFVTSAYLLNKDGERVDRVSNETVTFVVEFNRDMDVTVPLRVRFGSSMPYAEYEIAGEYVNARRWEGTYTLKTTIENGRQRINIENGRAADDHYLQLMETDSCRFGFEIDTTGAQAMMMQGTATQSGIELSWVQDDFATLAGYNVYRSEKEDGLYVRLNEFVLPADVTTFFDADVMPGVRYYYNFTVVKTDFSESAPSGKINLMSMDTEAPGIYHSAVRTAFTGSNLVVRATITDNLMIREAKLYYRTVGDAEWKSATMTNLNSTYSAVIPADHLSTDGLEYYIAAYDGINYTYKGSAENSYKVTVQLAVAASAKGDVDGDGVVTGKDALMLLQAINDLLNLDAEQFLRADLNGDGELSAAEALRILHYVSGKITTLVE